MRTYLQSDRKVLPKDEILRIDVLRLCDLYVLDMDGWLRHIDTEASPKFRGSNLARGLARSENVSKCTSNGAHRSPRCPAVTKHPIT
jgi:hypothetical protein